MQISIRVHYQGVLNYWYRTVDAERKFENVAQSCHKCQQFKRLCTHSWVASYKRPIELDEKQMYR